MSISDKIKAINSKIEQNKAQYNLDRQTAKISALSTGNVGKYEFLTGKDVLPEKDFLEKAATMKRFEYLPLDKELKSQTDIAKKQRQKLTNEPHEFVLNLSQSLDLKIQINMLPFKIYLFIIRGKI